MKSPALPIYLVTVKERGQPAVEVPCAGFDDLLAVYRSLRLRHEGDGAELRCSCPDEVDLDKADGLTREERDAIEDADPVGEECAWEFRVYDVQRLLMSSNADEALEGTIVFQGATPDEAVARALAYASLRDARAEVGPSGMAVYPNGHEGRTCWVVQFSKGPLAVKLFSEAF